MKHKIVRDEDGRVLYEHYYRAGGHIYEIPRGRGTPRAIACYRETPAGDGELLWEEHGGAELVQNLRESGRIA